MNPSLGDRASITERWSFLRRWPRALSNSRPPENPHSRAYRALRRRRCRAGRRDLQLAGVRARRRQPLSGARYRPEHPRRRCHAPAGLAQRLPIQSGSTDRYREEFGRLRRDHTLRPEPGGLQRQDQRCRPRVARQRAPIRPVWPREYRQHSGGKRPVDASLCPATRLSDRTGRLSRGRAIAGRHRKRTGGPPPLSGRGWTLDAARRRCRELVVGWPRTAPARCHGEYRRGHRADSGPEPPLARK